MIWNLRKYLFSNNKLLFTFFYIATINFSIGKKLCAISGSNSPQATFFIVCCVWISHQSIQSLSFAMCASKNPFSVKISCQTKAIVWGYRKSSLVQWGRRFLLAISFNLSIYCTQGAVIGSQTFKTSTIFTAMLNTKETPLKCNKYHRKANTT